MRVKDLPFKGVLFWSYEKEADLPEEEIIERVLTYGSIEELFSLVEIFGYDRCLEVYKRRFSSEDTKAPKTANFLRLFFDAIAPD